jgi:hypothetical protein
MTMTAVNVSIFAGDFIRFLLADAGEYTLSAPIFNAANVLGGISAANVLGGISAANVLGGISAVTVLSDICDRGTPCSSMAFVVAKSRRSMAR